MRPSEEAIEEEEDDEEEGGGPPISMSYSSANALDFLDNESPVRSNVPSSASSRMERPKADEEAALPRVT